jgi:hypothetical protein
MSRNNQALFFILVTIALLSALAPLSDLDFDGKLDSLITEGLVLVTTLCSVTGIFFLLTSLPAACPAVSWQFSALNVPPPIPD